MENHTTINKIIKRISNRQSIVFGITTTMLAIILFISNLILPKFSEFKESQRLKVEYIIAQKFGMLDKIGNVWLEDTSKLAKSAFSLIDEGTLNRLKNEGTAIYFAQNDDIVAWSDIPNFDFAIQKKIDTTAALYNFNNGFYLAKRIKKGNKSAILTIELQKKFHITNKFLSNTFNPILRLPKNVALLTELQKTSHKSYAIGYQGRPLFTLVQLNNKQDSSTKHLVDYLTLLLFILGTWNIIMAIPFGRKVGYFVFTIAAWVTLCVSMGKLLSASSSSLKIFSPQLYSSAIAPSLGLLFVYIFIATAVISTVYYHYVNYKLNKAKWITALAILHSTIISGINWFFFYLVYSLVNDSTISFGIFRIVELSRFSLLAYFIISLTIINIILLVGLFFRLFKDLSTSKKVTILVVPLLATTVLLLFKEGLGILFVTATLFTIYLFVSRIKAYQRIGIGVFSLIIVVWALVSSVLVCSFITTKDKFNKIAFAESLYNENDPIIESQLPDLYARLQADTTIARLLDNPQKNEAALNGYIRENYLNGYLSKYDMLLTICPNNSQLLLLQEKRSTNCQSYFASLFNQLGSRIPNSKFYHIRNYPGQISYIADLKYNTPSKPTSLYLELDVKTINNNPGYPELLIKDSQVKLHDYSSYDYALYIDGKLMAKNGDYSFPSLISQPTLEEKYFTNKANGFSLLYYRLDKHNTLVIARPKLRLFDVISSFSYVFILLAFGAIILLKRSHFPVDDSLSYRTFKGRITLSFIFILTVALALAAIGSLIYGIIRFDNVKQEIIQDKMKAAIPAVRAALNNSNNADLVNELIKVSNYLYVDVNLYDKQGSLFATSRPEVFSEGLQGYKMSPKAYEKLVLDYEGFYVNQENIGNMTYTSSYAPLFSNLGELLGYVNLPYFQEYNELRNEIYTIAIATANIFIILLLPVMFIGVVTSNSITRPLAQIRTRMRHFDLQTNLKPIPYNRNDEIGDLIHEFNKMVVQVKQSAEKLADSERESAWREMARQIAHEIKNPLTPMKLSLQYLMMLKGKNDQRWTEQFDRYAKSQIEQIDSLANIATEFSDFAKINFDEKTPIFDVRDLVNEVVPIFDGFEDLSLHVTLPQSPCSIQADREHVKRVFVNILKNATQSFEGNEHPTISVTVVLEGAKVRLAVEDNGKGIPDDLKSKIFVPNFTTKSSGSGLGLAISKNLVEAYYGKIWFDSTVGVGTTFYVEFPLKK